MPSPNVPTAEPRRPRSGRAVEVVDRSRLVRWRASTRASWWFLRPILLTVVLLGLFVLTYVAFTAWTTDGTYLRELTSSAIGALVTIAGSLAIAVIAFRRELRRQREATRLLRFDRETRRRSALQVGSMRIPDVMVVASCRQHHEWTEHASFSFDPVVHAARELDESGRAAREAFLPRLIAEASEQSVAFTDDPCVDLRRARIELRRDTGRRRPHYVLEAARAGYHDFRATAACLDAPIPDGPLAGRTLDELWDLDIHSIEDVDRLPCMAKIGVGTAVVTADRRLVLGVRGRTMIAGGVDARSLPPGRRSKARVHIVAEGMIPEDVDGDGLIDPQTTSIRALHEELLIGDPASSIARRRHHAATGFAVDVSRAQPFFTYRADVTCTWDELSTVAPAAQDFWEVTELRSLPFDIRHVGLRRLLMGRHPDMEFASNQAAATVWFACLHEFGLDLMRDALDRPLPVLADERDQRGRTAS